MDVDKLAIEIRQRFQDGDARLPVLPEAVIKVRQVVNDRSKGAEDITRIIGSDSTFSTTVLRIANSARFNTSGIEIRNLSMAIQRLGGHRTLQLLTVISSQLHMAVKDPSLQRLLRQGTRHSLRLATVGQHLARLIGGVDPDETFLAGMLVDVGIAAIICAAPEKIKQCNADDQLDILKQLHREMGGRLLTYWGMPDAFVSLASHHGVEADDRPRDTLIDLIDAAQFILHSMGHETPFDEIPDGIDALYYPPLKRLGVTATHLAAIEVDLEDGLEELEDIFSGLGH
jgi:HD-like signal output (HDOD) protein